MYLVCIMHNRLAMNSSHAFDMLHAATAITKTTGLTNAITKVVELSATSIATADDFELSDQRRVDRPSLLDTDFTNHATHSDVLVDSTTLA